MIDNYRKAMVLIAKINAALPIPARPSRSLVDLLMHRGVTLDADSWLQIRKVIYRGDEGGITCEISLADIKEVLLSSLTQLRIDPRHPLAGEIKAYQERRTRRLAYSDGALGVMTIKRKQRKV